MGTKVMKAKFSVCVFCSASSRVDRGIWEAAQAFSWKLAERNWALVYGGGASGLMGHFADSVLEKKGQVIGVIPTCLHDVSEVAHPGLTHLDVVDDLFERKRVMLRKSDAFVIFPGGWGTLDEAMEVLTWKVLGQLDKPIYFVNINGFWTSQLRVFDEMKQAEMVREEAFQHYSVASSVEEAFHFLDQDALGRGAQGA